MNKRIKRTLGLNDAISIVAGSMIGSGIFIVSAEMSRLTNSGLMLLLCWIISGIMTICGALCYAELSSTLPDDGGQYIYIKKIFGEKFAFVYAWTLFAVIQTGTLAAVNIAFAKFLGLIFPFFSEYNVLFSIGNFNVNSCQLLAAAVVCAITYINTRGIKEGMFVQNLFTVTKILAVVFVIFCGTVFGFKPQIFLANMNLPTFSGFGNFLSVMSAALVGSSFASITWNNVTFIASEVKKPARNIPKALLYGTFCVIALYFAINIVYLGAIPLELIKISPEDTVAAQLANVIFGSAGLKIIALIIVISAIGCANGMILSGSRIYCKTARDKLFFRALAKIDRKTKVPVNSLYFQCFWICALILWGSYSALLDYVIYSSLIFYMLTIAGIFRLRKSAVRKRGIFRVNNLVIITFLLISGFIVVGLTVGKPMYTIPGLIITGAGFPIYAIRKKLILKKQS